MPRTSRAAIEMQPFQAPPKPAEIEFPDQLETDEERKIYKQLVESNPSAHLFSRAAASLLVQLCRHQIMANKLARAIRLTDDPKLLISLAKSQKDESTAMSMLAVKLKMTPSSVAGSGYRAPTKTGPKPWE